jgi:hypothetical protein
MRTIFRVSVRPRRNRDRRRHDISDRANLLVQSLRSYLMAHEMSSLQAIAPPALPSPSLFDWLFNRRR